GVGGAERREQHLQLRQAALTTVVLDPGFTQVVAKQPTERRDLDRALLNLLGPRLHDLRLQANLRAGKTLRADMVDLGHLAHQPQTFFDRVTPTLSGREELEDHLA